jgi:hypothetical protein
MAWASVLRLGSFCLCLCHLLPLRRPSPLIAFEQIKPDYLLWLGLAGAASAGVLLVRAHLLVAYCLLQLIHGLDEGRGRETRVPIEKKAAAKEPLAL